jgi:CRISPR system Cascade subunit CasD
VAQTVLFRLEAAMASFGGLAVGEVRPTDRRPAHSAIAGLIAGSLGLERADAGHEALSNSFWMATRQDRLGSPLVDYHTAQPNRTGNAILSQRSYWTGTSFVVLLWMRDDAPYSAEAIAEALRRPRFAPFVGRKSCPLTRPMAPRVITASTISEAFAAYGPGDGEIAFDAALAPHLGEMTEIRRERRRDALLNRSRWQFGLRTECVATLNSGA